MSLRTFFEQIFPFLFSALQRAWDQLTPIQQSAVTNSGIIGQLLKNNLTILGDDLVELIAEKTDLPKEDIQLTLTNLAAKLGFTGTELNDAVKFLQGKLSSAASDEDWNGLLKTVLIAGGTLLSGGTLDWPTLALGVGEWAYQNIIVKKVPSVASVANTVVADATEAANVVNIVAPGSEATKIADEATPILQDAEKVIEVPTPPTADVPPSPVVENQGTTNGSPHGSPIGGGTAGQ